jgi:hypothetical protein
MPVVDDALVDDDDLLPDGPVASESFADSALPIAAIPVESLIADEKVMGFCQPLW